jgi:hypothetical protein
VFLDNVTLAKASVIKEPSFHYASYGTLLAVRDYYATQAIPIAYMQLDSWWYPKGPGAVWTDKADGQSTYTADTLDRSIRHIGARSQTTSARVACESTSKTG